jgi:S1-C subfamily serine protease
MQYRMKRPQRSPLDSLTFIVQGYQKLFLFFILVFATIPLSSHCPSALAKSNDFTKAAKKVMPAVVSIQVVKRAHLPEVSSFEEEFLRHFFGPSFLGS